MTADESTGACYQNLRWIRFFLANSRTALGLPPKLSAEMTMLVSITTLNIHRLGAVFIHQAFHVRFGQPLLLSFHTPLTANPLPFFLLNIAPARSPGRPG